MKIKNILLLSIATTLLFASYVEGMEKQRKQVSLFFTLSTNKDPKQQLEELNKNEQCDITLTCGGPMLDESWLNALLEKIYGNPPKLISLKIRPSKYFNPFEVHWKKCRCLETLTFDFPTFWGVSGSVKIFNRIIENNPNLSHLSLKSMLYFPNKTESEEKINWKALTNLKKVKLVCTLLTEISVNAILEHNPNLTYLDLSYSKIILKNVDWEKAKKLEKLYLIGTNPEGIDATREDAKIIQEKCPNVRIYLKH